MPIQLTLDPTLQISPAQFAAAWNAEGAALAKAVPKTDEAAAQEAGREFLEIRDKRRAAAGLAADLADSAPARVAEDGPRRIRS
jgi:hypothetical protein